MPLINLAFSGNGRLEPELLDLLTEIDAKVYVLDCLPNLTSGYISTGELKKRIANAVRQLRNTIHATMGAAANAGSAEAEGVEISLILSEVKPIGSFIGASVSEPLLQGNILLSVLGCMIFLQPQIAMASLLVFSPQLIFVP